MASPSTIPYEPLPEPSVFSSPNLSTLEQTEWALQPDLDIFFIGIYKYWRGKGFYANLLREASNLLALLFLLALTSFLMFFVNWRPDHTACHEDGQSCDIADMYLRNPLAATKLSIWTALRLCYLILFVLYWLGTLAVSINEAMSARSVMLFCKLKLGISEEQIRWVTWPELVRRLVLIQKTTRLCLKRDLTEHEIISRILRKENYLMGMINKGILRLNLPLLGFKKRHILTKMLEWSLRWGVLNPMFDSDFEIREPYKTDPTFLTKRLRTLAIFNFVLAPFILVSLVISFLMTNLERFYHQPSSLAERSWSPYAQWKMREFNELEHQLEARLAQSCDPAQDYVNQFPRYSLMHIGRLIAFVLESCMALLICLALLDDSLLEHGDIMGRNLVWWAAILMIGLRIARGLTPEFPTLDPDICMQKVIVHTHYYPKIWRGHTRSKEVQESFLAMFRYRAMNMIDEVLSIFLAPYILYFSLPQSSEWIVQFLQHYTIRVDGVGDVCSLAMFDFERHGNKRYGSAVEGRRSDRSKQGKMEKSFLTFAATYPSWQPSSIGEQFLENLSMFRTSQFVPDNSEQSPETHYNSTSRQLSADQPRSSVGGSVIEMTTLLRQFTSRRSNHDGDAVDGAEEEMVLDHRRESSIDVVESHHVLQRFYVYNKDSV